MSLVTIERRFKMHPYPRLLVDRPNRPQEDDVWEFKKGGNVMNASLLSAKSKHFIVATILVSTLMVCWCAEPAFSKSRPRDASSYVHTRIEKNYEHSGATVCLARNRNPEKHICVVYDVYPYWLIFSPVHAKAHQIILRRLDHPGDNKIYSRPDNEQPPMQCTLIDAKYVASIFSQCP